VVSGEETLSFTVNVEELETFDTSKATPHGKGGTAGHPRITEECLRSALLRSGWAAHVNLEEVASRLTQYDDVIICTDTNMLLDCLLSAILLPVLNKYEEPNWILIAIPKVVMAEIESQADGRLIKHAGYPSFRYRSALRALQEVLALDTSKGEVFKGLSIMTVGDLPQDFKQMEGDSVRKDSAIRRQFRDFLRSITFHKGSFLISQDRVNVMMARAEGMEGLYLQKPDWEDLVQASCSPLTQYNTVSRLVYELAVSFGSILLRTTKRELVLDSYWPGKQVLDWEYGRIFARARAR
jgi:hypothetical protein